MTLLRLQRHGEFPFPDIEKVHAQQLSEWRFRDFASPHCPEEFRPGQLSRLPPRGDRVIPGYDTTALRLRILRHKLSSKAHAPRKATEIAGCTVTIAPELLRFSRD
jgi:hypothetical protein